MLLPAGTPTRRGAAPSKPCAARETTTDGDNERDPEGNGLVLVASQLRRWRAHGLLNVYNSRSTHRTTRVCYIDEVAGLSFSRMH